MPDGGFILTIDGKEIKRGYLITADYDKWTYTVNNEDPQPIPPGARSITIEVESE